MTLSPVFNRFSSFAAVAVTGAALFAIAPAAQAAGGNGYYSIELAQPAASSKAIVRGVAVVCNGTSCHAPVSGSTPKNMCVSIAKELGEVATFKAGDRVLESDDLASCNAKKKANIARN